jgi:hypothetical protein
LGEEEGGMNKSEIDRLCIIKRDLTEASIMSLSILVAMSVATTPVYADVSQDCDKMNVGDGKMWNKGMVFELQEKCFNLDNIDCSDVTYSANITKTLMIMKFCTRGEKELK